jgi:hypothetical protein
MYTKYERWHDQIVARARKRKLKHIYFERHHIVPRAFKGSDEKSNLVDLTYREHFLIHWLLTKLHPTGRPHTQMVMALHCMTFSAAGQRFPASWHFDVVKRALADQRMIGYRQRCEQREKQYWANVAARSRKAIAAARKVDEEAHSMGLSMRSGSDREKLAEMTRAWIKAVPRGRWEYEALRGLRNQGQGMEVADRFRSLPVHHGRKRR